MRLESCREHPNAIFGARVMRFGWLFREIAARAGFAGREASDFQRELIGLQFAARDRRATARQLSATTGPPDWSR